MSTPLKPVILESGLAAIWRATNDGVSAQITHIALGDAGYDPSQAQQGMRSMKVRYPVADGARVSPRRIHLTALADGAIEFWVREVGFLLSDGTVFAVWSHPTTAIAYKAPNVDLLLAYDLELVALPADSVTVVSTGAGLNLSMATELARIASAAIGGMLRELRMSDRCAAIERRVDASDKAMALLQTEIDATRRRVDHSKGRQLWP
jgi:hypothetical protein